jgi:hypothetical protein
MSSEQRVRELAPLLKPLEQEEPLVCAWRVEAGRPPSPNGFMKKTRGWLRWGRDGLRRLRAPQRPNPGQVVVFPTSWTPSTWGTLRPILVELARRKSPAFLVTNNRTRPLLSQGLHRGHADIMEIVATLPAENRRQVHQQSRALGNELGRLLRWEEADNAEAWLEHGLAIRESVHHWLCGAGAVVLDSDTEAQRKGFVLGAAEVGVRSVVLQHGLFGSHQFPFHADSLFCWGNYFCRQAESYGLEPERVVPVGCPRWDKLAAIRALPGDTAIRLKLGSSWEKPLVLLISTADGAADDPEIYSRYFQSIEKMVEAGFDLAIRLHPAELGSSTYKQSLRPDTFACLRFTGPDLTLHDAVRSADVVYHVFSAASLEVMQLGVPILFERVPASQQLCDFPDHGGGDWSNPNSIVDRVMDLTGSREVRLKAIEKQDGFLDQALVNRGHAAEVVVDNLLGTRT